MNREKKDLYDLVAEISGIGMIIVGLGNQIDGDEVLTPESMKEALYGVRSYLDRISDDLLAIDAKS